MPLRFLVVLIVVALCAPADAQQAKKIPRIGFLSTTSFPLVRVEAFQQGLRELGWVEGRNITVEHRHPERNFDQAAADLVRLSADIIVTAARQQTVQPRMQLPRFPSSLLELAILLEMGLSRALRILAVTLLDYRRSLRS